MNNNPDQDGSFAPLSSEEQKTSEEPKTFARLELFQLLTSNLASPEVRLAAAWCSSGCGKECGPRLNRSHLRRVRGAHL